MVFSQPFLLRSLLVNRDALSALSLFAVTLVGGLTEAHMKFQLRLVGVKLRAALTSAICNEGLSVMQPSSAPDPSVIVEVDLPHIFEFIENCHVAWMLPLQIILSLAALVYILDAYSISAGLLASVSSQHLRLLDRIHPCRKILTSHSACFASNFTVHNGPYTDVYVPNHAGEGY